MTTVNNTGIVFLVIAAFGAGFLSARLSPTAGTDAQNEESTFMNSIVAGGSTTMSIAATTSMSQREVDVFISSMTDDQKRMLSALGIDLNRITPAMIACAQSSLGEDRLEEIKEGAPLSFTEKAKLLVCYKK